MLKDTCFWLLGAQFSYSWDPDYFLEEETKHGPHFSFSHMFICQGTESRVKQASLLTGPHLGVLMGLSSISVSQSFILWYSSPWSWGQCPCMTSGPDWVHECHSHLKGLSPSFHTCCLNSSLKAIHFVVVIVLCLVLFYSKVLLCSPGGPITSSPVSASWILQFML